MSTAPPGRPARRRDPEGRRRALAVAVLEVITEVGIGRTTHRAVAERAGVPLGATTYYFPTLADMVAAGLAKASADLAADLRKWAEYLGDGVDLPRRFTRLLCEYLDDTRAVTELELYVAAVRSPELRPLALAWLDQIRQLLTPLVGDGAARMLAAFMDGVALQWLVTREPVDPAVIESAVTALIAGGASSPSAPHQGVPAPDRR